MTLKPEENNSDIPYAVRENIEFESLDHYKSRFRIEFYEDEARTVPLSSEDAFVQDNESDVDINVQWYRSGDNITYAIDLTQNGSCTPFTRTSGLHSQCFAAYSYLIDYYIGQIVSAPGSRTGNGYHESVTTDSDITFQQKTWHINTIETIDWTLSHTEEQKTGNYYSRVYTIKFENTFVVSAPASYDGLILVTGDPYSDDLYATRVTQDDYGN